MYLTSLYSCAWFGGSPRKNDHTHLTAILQLLGDIWVRVGVEGRIGGCRLEVAVGTGRGRAELGFRGGGRVQLGFRGGGRVEYLWYQSFRYKIE